jgi:hypothetical protein
MQPARFPMLKFAALSFARRESVLKEEQNEGGRQPFR